MARILRIGKRVHQPFYDTPTMTRVTWWTRLGRPPHVITTPRERRFMLCWSLAWLGMLTIIGYFAWPHWTVSLAIVLGMIQVFQVVTIRAQASWAKRYCDQVRGEYTGHFTKHSAIRREFEVNTGSVSGFYSSIERELH